MIEMCTTAAARNAFMLRQ